MTLTDEIRERAAWVAGRARSVRIEAGAIAAYAAGLPAESPPAPDLEGAVFLVSLAIVWLGVALAH